MLYMAILVTILRCLIVSIRYATTSNTRIIDQSAKIFTNADNDKEFMGTGWRDVEPEVLDIEIKHSMIRNEVENSLFAIKFLNKITPDVIDRLTDYHYYSKKKYSFK